VGDGRGKKFGVGWSAILAGCSATSLRRRRTDGRLRWHSRLRSLGPFPLRPTIASRQDRWLTTRPPPFPSPPGCRIRCIPPAS
jgi:hypothetical protein